jgi:hypothetical protein
MPDRGTPDYERTLAKMESMTFCGAFTLRRREQHQSGWRTTTSRETPWPPQNDHPTHRHALRTGEITGRVWIYARNV